MQVFVKGLGFVTDNDSHKQMLIDNGYIQDDTTKEKPNKHVRSNTKRTSKSKRSV